MVEAGVEGGERGGGGLYKGLLTCRGCGDASRYFAVHMSHVVITVRSVGVCVCVRQKRGSEGTTRP
jgi:hypothetical protein